MVDIAGGRIQSVSQVDNSSVSIIIPPEVFNSSVLSDEEEIAMVFAEYDSPILYPLPSNSVLFTDENVTYTNFSVASTLLTATIVGHEDDIVDLETNVTFILKLDSEVLKFTCTYNSAHVFLYLCSISNLSYVFSGMRPLQVCYLC